MNAMSSGAAAAIFFMRSRVGPHWALVQKAGVAKISTNGRFWARASLTDSS